MHTLLCAVIKRYSCLGLLIAAALALVPLPVSGQRILADTLKNGHLPQALRGRLDASPDKSVHYLPSTGVAPLAASAAEGPAAPPHPIVTPFLEPSSRSGSVNYGFLVGNNPFTGGEGPNSSVKTFIVPLVFKVHQVATDFSTDANGYLTLAGITNQDATFDVTQPSPACLGDKNNVPFTLAVQSPVFQKNHWVWGGTDLGDAQYIDAFQRANFWNATGKDPGDYRLHLNTKVLPSLVIDFPTGSGIGLPQSSSFLNYSSCAPTVLVDFNLFDEYLDYIALPQLAAYGVNSSNFTMFIGGNVIWGAVIGQLPYYVGEAAGYHSYSGVDPALTYGVTQFGDEPVFNWPDAVPLSHEVGEWANDPTGSNGTAQYAIVFPPGSPAYCQGNYEVGDILSGVFMPPVTGKNGYTYTLQELAFFSYFYGKPSLGVNGWYSNNNTLTTDAGPVCSPF